MLYSCIFFFFKQKTAYEMRISDWSSDVCSSDLAENAGVRVVEVEVIDAGDALECAHAALVDRVLDLGAVKGAALVAARFAGEEISDLGIAAEIGRIGRAGQVDALLHPMGSASEVERTEDAGGLNPIAGLGRGRQRRGGDEANRSEEHTYELQ